MLHEPALASRSSFVRALGSLASWAGSYADLEIKHTESLDAKQPWFCGSRDGLLESW